MKQIVVISGKGGTGKSTVVASLAFIAKNKIIVDCDVDAPNLHMLVQKERNVDTEEYYGANRANINLEACIECGICKDSCPFGAINEHCEIISVKCEGCGVCKLKCPVGAIDLKPVKTGDIFVDETSEGIFCHAFLDIGAEGSGKLVSRVRKKARENHSNENWTLIDGSPGTGCAVIASLTGTDMAVVVSEPTKTGLSDLERILALVKHFNILGVVCINKHDLNPEITGQIEKYCEKQKVAIIGRISFEPRVVDALRELKTPARAGLKEIGYEMENIWKKIECIIG